VDGISIAKPKLVLELGSGTGSLCTAAAIRWHDAKLITVDVDRRAANGFASNNIGFKSRHNHFVQNVLDSALSDKIGLPLSSVDVAVCNPPYVRPRWCADYGKILEDAGLSGALASMHDAGADLLFLAQNLRLLRKNGKLGVILPDGLVTAERFKGVRKTLLQQHLVEQVVQLPRGVFRGTEAQTYLAVLSKNSGETANVVLKQMGRDGKMRGSLTIPQSEAVRRLDFSFHLGLEVPFMAANVPPMFVSEGLSGIFRGTVCSSEIATLPVPVFHLGDFSKASDAFAIRIVPKRFSLNQRAARRLSPNRRLAIPGDILLGRVGRGLESKVALVVHGSCVISDCIFVLRAKCEFRERLYRFFESNVGRNSLASSAHGVAARFISKTNLFEIQF
jgi:type I restriction enzyme M protein